VNDRTRLAISVRDLYVDYEIVEQRRSAILDRVVRRRGTGHRVVRAVKGVTFDIHEGEAVALVGTNGSGKSTLAASIAGLLRPTSGEVLVSDVPRLLGVGSALMPGSTGWTNIRIGCLALGMPGDEIEERLSEIADFTELGEALDRPMRTYSSGMRARLHFAIATAVKPRILIIDEALTVGDAGFKAKSAARIEGLVADAGTLILVSHSPGEIRRQCSRALWLDKGMLRDDGPPNKVLSRYEKHVAGAEPPQSVAAPMASSTDPASPTTPRDTATAP